jgi:hypothetical protein
MKALNIIETAYRATLEEQDDTIVWITHAMKGAGADLGVLLRGNAVNYAVEAQSVTPLAFGARQQKHGPDIARDIAGLVAKGLPVYYVAEDAAVRGLDTGELVEGLTPIHQAGLPGLLEGYDHVWHW